MQFNCGPFLVGRHYRVSFAFFVAIAVKLLYDLLAVTKLDQKIIFIHSSVDKVEVKHLNVSEHVNIIDLNEPSDDTIKCIKTKSLLHNVRTSICLHDERDAVSNIIAKDKIWEEKHLSELLSFLIRYPNVHFIDAGANVGVYTMFMAAFGRLVLSIECFKPNINRIRKAIQIEQLQNKVVLVGNAIFSDSGKYLKMKSDPFNIGSQAVITDSNASNTIDDMYTVRTIQFDDILPILVEKNMTTVIMKVDIQWSEIHLCHTGNKTFDLINIPIVLMEWDVGALHYARLRAVINYFIRRGYVPTSDMCSILKESDALGSWPSDVYWMKINMTEIC